MLKRILVFLLALLLAIPAFAEGKKTPIDFNDNFEELGYFLVSQGFEIMKDGPNTADWSHEIWDEAVGGKMQYQVTFSNHDRPDAVNADQYAAVRERFTALLGEPVLNQGDGKVIELTLAQMPTMYEPFSAVMITGESIPETSYGSTITKTTEVQDGCVYLFCVQNQPAILHLALVSHEETSDSPNVKPRSYLSVDFRCTAIDEYNYNSALEQASAEGQSLQPSWAPPVRLNEYLQDVVIRTMDRLTEDFLPIINVSCESVDYSSGSALSRVRLVCDYVTNRGSDNDDWKVLVWNKIINAGYNPNGETEEEMCLYPGKIPDFDRDAFADYVVQDREDVDLILGNQYVHAKDTVLETGDYLVILNGLPVLLDVAKVHRVNTAFNQLDSELDLIVAQYSALDNAAYEQIKAYFRNSAGAQTEAEAVPEITPEPEAEAATEPLPEITETPEPTPEITPDPTETPELENPPRQYEFSRYICESQLFAGVGDMMKGTGYVFYDDGTCVTYDAQGNQTTTTYTVEDASSFTASADDSVRFTDVYVLAPIADAEPIRLYLSGDTLWFDAPITWTSTVNGVDSSTVYGSDALFAARDYDAAAFAAAQPEPSAAEASGTSDILTEGSWQDGNGYVLTLNPDGTGTLSTQQDRAYEGAWTADGGAVTFSYELYGARTLSLWLRESEGEFVLASNNGDYRHVAG